MIRRLVPLVLIVLLSLCAVGAQAAPTLGVSPTTIDWNASGTVTLTIGGLTGTAAYVRLYADVDGNGALSAGDYIVWTDVARDNVTEWAPTMISDTNFAIGALTLSVPPLIAPFRYPHTAGKFLWQVEDSTGGAFSPAMPFTITQTTEAQSVSGQVQDMSATPVPGALVFLAPLNDEGEPDPVSCFADQNGNFTLNLPANRALPTGCSKRLLLALKPGYVTPWMMPAQPLLTFTGSSVFTGQVTRVRVGTSTIVGQATYASGPKNTQGIPGAWVFAESQEGPQEMSVAVADRNGNYSFSLSASPLSDGSFQLACRDSINLALQGAVDQENYGAMINVDSGPYSGNLSYRAADAWVQGTVRNTGGAGAGPGIRLVGADTGCFTPTPGPCYFSHAVTRADGSYTLGVVGGTGNSQALQVEQGYIPAGQITAARACDVLSAGQTLTGADLSFANPTFHITGRATDRNGAPLANLPILGSLTGGCTYYNAVALTDCSGNYDLPVLNGNWSVFYPGGDLNGIYRNVDGNRVQRSLTVAGASLSGVNFIFSRWAVTPSINTIEPPSGVAGSQILMRVEGLSFSGAPPAVYFGAVASPSVLYRPDLGYCIAEVPSGLTPGSVSVTAVNTDAGFVSNAVCFTALAGTWTGTCTLSGAATAPGGGPAGTALVLIRDNSSYRYFQRAAVPDGSGNWAAPMAAAGSYNLVFIPPPNTAWAWATYAISCGTPQNHAFQSAYWVSGTIKDGNGDFLENAMVAMPGREERSLTDVDGHWQIPLANGTYGGNFSGPFGSRLVGNQGWNATVSGASIDVGTTTLNPGVYFIGHTLDQAGNGLPDVRVNATNGTGQGRSMSTSCDGQFTLAMPANTACTLNLTLRNASSTSAEVRTVTVAYDTFSEYDFTVPDPAAIPVLKGNKPAIQPDYDAYGQVGQPIHIMAENLAGTTVQVRFSNGSGGFVVGNNTMVETTRNLLATTVPPGAATGKVWVNVDGQDSPPMAFIVNPGTFSPGSLTLQGTVTASGLPVSGVFVLVFQTPSGSGQCEGAGGPQSYTTTNASGQYSLTTNAGDVLVLFMPPGATQLAVVVDQLPGLSSGMTLDKTLSTGHPVHVKLIDSVSLLPIQNGRFDADGKSVFTFDTRLTDANGDATLYLSAQTYETRLSGPALSRYIEQSNESLAVSGAVELGTVSMGTGYFGEARFTRAGAAIPGMEIDSYLPSGWTSFSRTYTDASGVALAPVPANTTFNIQMYGPTDVIADYSLNNLGPLTTRDVIRYPSDPVPAAGIITGRVTTSGGAPLQDIEVYGTPDFNGSDSWTRTCSDGYYRLKSPVGSRYVSFNGYGQDATHVSKWWNDTYCESTATPVNVQEGLTVSGINAALPTTVAITGRVRANRTPLQNAWVCAQGGPMGNGSGCSACASTDTLGNYTINLLAGSNYQVTASAPGYPNQNYNHHNTSGVFDSVTAPATNINFDLGTPPAEPSDCDSSFPLKVTRLTQFGPHAVRLSFEKVSGAESYHIYQGLIGGYYASGRICNLLPAALVDDGSTYHYDFGASTSNVWFLISDSNVVSESPLTQTGTCAGPTSVDPTTIPRCGATP